MKKYWNELLTNHQNEKNDSWKKKCDQKRFKLKVFTEKKMNWLKNIYKSKNVKF